MGLEHCREDFPILDIFARGKPLVYLDNAATMQMPRQVMWAITEHYRQSNANVHRGVHFLSQRSTDMLEQARQTVADYIGAASPDEIIFTAGTTESLNQLARMLKNQIRPGQQILVSAMEHHSNLLPWQILCKETGTELNLIPLDENCDLDLDAFQELLQKPTALVCVAWVSNVLGTVNPVDRVVKMAHNAGALVCVDGAQAMKQENINVQMFDCDFFLFRAQIGCTDGNRSAVRKTRRIKESATRQLWRWDD